MYVFFSTNTYIILTLIFSYSLKTDETNVSTSRRSIASVALADESALAFGIGDEDEDPEYIQASRCGKYLFCQ